MHSRLSATAYAPRSKSGAITFELLKAQDDHATVDNLPAGMDPRSLAATIKARWICEQVHQQLKEELGLDHFEGRSWHGLHRHALMTMIAYAFLQHRGSQT